MTDPRYLLTSLEPAMACHFAGKAILLAIEIGDSVKGLVTGNRSEMEVLLPRDLEMTVLGSKREKGYTIYHLRAG